ncbi:MAG: conserved exported protein of unknown function [Candidatus Thorarchaeota archaeon]|nr:MAG: conserved exported protein of unknown function [Candidatus Thorarchaeota archaeon]
MKILSALLIVIMFLNPLSAADNESVLEYIPAAEGVSLRIDFDNGTVRTFNDLSADTVLNLTESVISVEYEWQGDLVFVTAIGGVEESPQEGLWWQYWVNEELGPVAANKYILDNQDVVEWKLSPYNAPTTTTEDPSLYLSLLLLGTIGIGFLIFISKRGKS